MKRLIKQIYHFLGGIRCAILLIALAACMVIAGTILESRTDSHRYASQWTYGHPLFQILLCFFFINILFSALRRWPFRKKHVPFLMTHLGLLMIISGTFIKNLYGLQGYVNIWEGSGSQQVVLPGSHALLIENPTLQSIIPLDSFHRRVYSPPLFPELKCKIINYTPHSEERFETWIKGEKAYPLGLPPLPVQQWLPETPLPTPTQTAFIQNNSVQWNLLALQIPFQKSSMESLIKDLYLHELILELTTKYSETPPYSLPLKQALTTPFVFEGLEWKAIVNLPYSMERGIHNARIELSGTTPEGQSKERLIIPLQYQGALYVKADENKWDEPRFNVDFKRKNPLLCFIGDQEGDAYILAFDAFGRMHCERFSQTQLQSFIAYDHGFGGYAVQATLPFSSLPASRSDKEQTDIYAFKTLLQQTIVDTTLLVPPLQILEQACRRKNVSFPSIFTEFLIEWSKSPRLLFQPITPLSQNLQEVLADLDWKEASEIEIKGSLWSERLLEQIEMSLKAGEDPLKILENNRWPFLKELQQRTESTSLTNCFVQQVFSIASYLPSLPFPSKLSAQQHALLLSVFLRGYGIDPRLLFSGNNGQEEQADRLRGDQPTIIETSLTHCIQPKSPPLKVEDHRPGIVLEIQEGINKQLLALSYDPTGTGLKWPILNGSYRIRFQPQLKELPYRIRLRQARQISYPDTPQIYSYECDILLSENGQIPSEVTLSMNKVYETWNGYRFYLSGVGTSGDLKLKRVQLVVNYDPVKYLLTYPGAFLVFFGAACLFWGRSNRKYLQ